MSGMEGEVGEEYFCETLPLRTLHKDGGGVGLGVVSGDIQGARRVWGEGGKGEGGGTAGWTVGGVHVAYIGRAQENISHKLMIIIIGFPNKVVFFCA
jgi:hypothetical protein